jgi:hypothetical protein
MVLIGQLLLDSDTVATISNTKSIGHRFLGDHLKYPAKTLTLGPTNISGYCNSFNISKMRKISSPSFQSLK